MEGKEINMIGGSDDESECRFESVAMYVWEMAMCRWRGRRGPSHVGEVWMGGRWRRVSENRDSRG